MAQELKQQHIAIVTGPESTGKSTLAKSLAVKLGAPLVPEVARAYLESREATHGDYTREDVLAIARAQQVAENQALESGATWVVADTDQLTTELWWSEKYAPAAFSTPVIDAPLRSVRRSYLLCYPDIDWQPDPLRENPDDRDRLFQLQMQALDAIAAPYRVIWGRGKFRERLAWQYIKTLGDK